MTENETKQAKNRAVLVGLNAHCLSAEENADDTSMEELADLLETAGGVCVGTVFQNKDAPDPRTFIGEGKAAEVKELVGAMGADMVVVDNPLSPSQQRVLSEELGVQVLDRAALILDIFAQRARTREGRIQVELAQLKYRAARLVGMRASLSRLGGGIGTRGPGEKKLEVDRRLIHERIGQLKAELEDVKRHREVTRQQREQGCAVSAAIVGYTNAGKSTLLNHLTDADILAEDKLFATLDPTTRSFYLEDGQQILLTDTVGFIRKLPHHLIEAFKSTLEEARYSDIILHVVDCSNPQMDMQMYVVKETLRELGIVDKTVVTVFNKIDRLDKEEGMGMLPRDFASDYQVRISAKTGEGIEELEQVLGSIIRSSRIYLEKVYPYSQAGRIQTIRTYGQLLSEEYTEQGIAVTAYVPAELFEGLYRD